MSCDFSDATKSARTDLHIDVCIGMGGGGAWHTQVNATSPRLTTALYSWSRRSNAPVKGRYLKYMNPSWSRKFSFFLNLAVQVQNCNSVFGLYRKHGVCKPWNWLVALDSSLVSEASQKMKMCRHLYTQGMVGIASKLNQLQNFDRLHVSHFLSEIHKWPLILFLKRFIIFWTLSVFKFEKNATGLKPQYEFQNESSSWHRAVHECRSRRRRYFILFTTFVRTE